MRWITGTRRSDFLGIYQSEMHIFNISITVRSDPYPTRTVFVVEVVVVVDFFVFVEAVEVVVVVVEFILVVVEVILVVVEVILVVVDRLPTLSTPISMLVSTL